MHKLNTEETSTFNVEQITNDLIVWIRNWFASNGNNCNAFIGISGGKDSTITAALMARALGVYRVYGVSMPDASQNSNVAINICKYLGINYIEAPINESVVALTTSYKGLTLSNTPVACYLQQLSKQATLNIPARIRMVMLYAISQTLNGRVINTCNLSENYVGYETIFGDAAGDMSPLGKLTVTEILQIGDYLNLPKAWVHKTPDDGLPNSKPDEQKLGFTYADLDKAIRGKSEFTDEMKTWHNKSNFKRIAMPTFNPTIDR